jgi:Yip1 domain
MDPKNIVSDLKGLKKEDMISEVKAAMNVALLKKDVMAQVQDDPKKTKFGYYIIAVEAILGMLGMQLFGGWIRPSLVNGLISMVIQAVMAVVGIYVVSFIAKKLFKGAATHEQFFRVAAYGMIVMWLSILPQISIVYGIWSLVLSFVILKTVHKLSTGGVIGTWIVTLVLYMVVGFLVAALGLGGIIGMGSMGSFGGSHSSYGNSSFNFGNNGSMKISTPQGEVNFNIPTTNP